MSRNDASRGRLDFCLVLREENGRNNVRIWVDWCESLDGNFRRRVKGSKLGTFVINLKMGVKVNTLF
jgi:hypothetical protein